MYELHTLSLVLPLMLSNYVAISIGYFIQIKILQCKNYFHIIIEKLIKPEKTFIAFKPVFAWQRTSHYLSIIPHVQFVTNKTAIRKPL